jgi:hypothetical protein
MPSARMVRPTAMMSVIASLVIAMTSITVVAGELRWQIGICTDAGVKRDVFVGGRASGRTPYGPDVATAKPTSPEIATYVLETEDRRFEIKDIAPIGPTTLNMMPGDRVALAVDKKTVYIRDSKGVQYRFRLVKNSRKVVPRN